ncbi:MAG: MBOAT family O-acyltransferase [Saprospiraceae bacterium]|nr:MBOAT family O-acyltransferase [Saprospiraceae bacterium]
MLFPTLDFALFLPTVFFLYWFVAGRGVRARNALLLGASYVFYGWWDWRFCLLMLFSTAVDYFAARQLSGADDPGRRRLVLGLSIAINLGLLGFFKYANFFIAQFSAAFSFFGHPVGWRSLDIILPVGISFYTFQTMSYTIDVYRRRLEASRDPVAFAAYVSFFPQLVAGPIERAASLLPQFESPRRFSYRASVDGLRQILWGLFKKVVVADSCAVVVDDLFANPAAHNGSALLLGAFLFAFQVYGDFSGYSDIAIGTARLFGFTLMRNFAYPFFSRDLAEYWRRWHISLSTWFRDYLYQPLGGSRGGRWMSIRNTTIVFLVSGFWHGANWTYILWGAVHALLFIPLLLLGRNRLHLDTVAHGRRLPSWQEMRQMSTTFLLLSLSLVLFRAESLTHAGTYFAGLLDRSLFAMPTAMPETTLFFIGILLAFEWVGREQPHALALPAARWPRPARWALYYTLAFAVVLLSGEQKPFIYFQF